MGTWNRQQTVIRAERGRGTGQQKPKRSKNIYSQPVDTGNSVGIARGRGRLGGEGQGVKIGTAATA